MTAVRTWYRRDASMHSRPNTTGPKRFHLPSPDDPWRSLCTSSGYWRGKPKGRILLCDFTAEEATLPPPAKFNACKRCVKIATAATAVQPLTERERDVLRWLDDEQWQTPMNIGARDSSWHSWVLRKLVGRGLVERKKIHATYCPNGSTYREDKHGNVTEGHPPYEGCRCKGSCRYRRTAAGHAALGRAFTPTVAAHDHRIHILDEE